MRLGKWFPEDEKPLGNRLLFIRHNCPKVVKCTLSRDGVRLAYRQEEKNRVIIRKYPDLT